MLRTTIRRIDDWMFEGQVQSDTPHVKQYSPPVETVDEKRLSLFNRIIFMCELSVVCYSSLVHRSNYKLIFSVSYY